MPFGGEGCLVPGPASLHNGHSWTLSKYDKNGMPLSYVFFYGSKVQERACILHAFAGSAWTFQRSSFFGFHIYAIYPSQETITNPKQHNIGRSRQALPKKSALRNVSLRQVRPRVSEVQLSSEASSFSFHVLNKLRGSCAQRIQVPNVSGFWSQTPYVSWFLET